MDFDLSDEQEMLRDAARRFVGEHYSFESRRGILAAPAAFSRPLWASYADMGWLALGLPEDVGGLGCSFIETVLLMEEFGRVLALEPYVSSAVLCARIIDQSGNQSQRAALLPRFLEGRLLMALAHSEPGTRYSRSALRCTATAVGANYLLNGEKTLVFDAPSADCLLVSALTTSGIGVFLVERDRPGVAATDYRLIDGTRAGDVALRDARVPASALIVESGGTPEVVEEALDRVALAQIAEALGAMEAVLSITNSYLKQRVQFGQTLNNFQALQHRMAEMFVEVQEARSSLYRGIAHLSAAPAQRAAAVSAAKVVAGNAARFVGAQGIQLHGGIGMTDEYAVGHYYKKLLAFDKRYGDADFHMDRFLQLQSGASCAATGDT